MSNSIKSAIKAAIAVTPTDNRDTAYLRNLLTNFAKSFQGAPTNFVISNTRDEAVWSSRPDRETGMWLLKGCEVSILGPNGPASSRIDLLFDDGKMGYLLVGYRATVYDDVGKAKSVTRTDGADAYANNKDLAQKVSKDIIGLFGFDPSDPKIRNSADTLATVKDVLKSFSQDAGAMIASATILQSLQIQLPMSISFSRGIVTVNERNLLDTDDKSICNKLVQDFIAGSGSRLDITATFRDPVLHYNSMKDAFSVALSAFKDKNSIPFKLILDEVTGSGSSITVGITLVK